MKSRILNPHNVGLCCSTRWTVLFHTLDCVVPHVVGRCLHMCWQSSTPRDLPFVCFFQCERREGGRIPHTRLLSTLQMMMRPEILPNVFEPPPPVWNRGFYYYFNSVTWKPPPHSCFCSGKRNRILFRNRIAGPLLFARSPWKAQSWREVVIKKKVISAKDIISHTIKGHPPCVIDREKEGLPTISVTHLQPHPNPPSAS